MSRRSRTGSIAQIGWPVTVLVGWILVAVATPTLAVEPHTLIADRTLQPDGKLVEGMAVVIGRDGRIERVVPAETAGLPSPRRFGPGSVLSPGLHELFGRLGSPGETRDNTRPIDAGARARDAIDPEREDLDRARRGGVLVATVAPSAINPVSGQAVTFATGARSRLEVLGEGPMIVAVGVSALDPNREPTSRAGLRNWLGSWLDRSKNPRSYTVFCDEPVDVRLARELFAGRPAPTFVVRSDVARCAPMLAPLGTVAVVGPYTERTAPDETTGAATLARAGIEIAFRGSMPTGDENSLRLTAALAARSGLDAAAARRGMTSNPARLAGVSDHVGRIETGRRADLVVFSGDPLDVRSEVVAVYERGISRRVSKEPAKVPTLEDPR